MTLSLFDQRLLEEGLTWFDRPRLASLLEMLGTTTFEGVETLVTMLRNSPPEEFATTPAGEAPSAGSAVSRSNGRSAPVRLEPVGELFQESQGTLRPVDVQVGLSEQLGRCFG